MICCIIAPLWCCLQQYLYCFFFLLDRCVFRIRGIRLLLEKNRDRAGREYFLEIILSFLLLAAVGAVFLYEPAMYDAGSYYMPWHGSRMMECLVLGFGVLLGMQIRKQLPDFYGRISGGREKKITLYPMYLFLSLAGGYALYQPDCFSKYYNLYHSDAYFHSIYRVLQLQPYTEANTGVYGFYGLIAAPFVKLLGGDFKACAVFLALLASVSILCLFYVLENLVETMWLRLAGGVLIVNLYVALTSHIYYQLIPHRIVFVAFVLAYCVWMHKNDRLQAKWQIAGFVLLVLSVIWNMETGIACLTAYVGSCVVRSLQNGSVFSKETIKKILLAVLMIPAVPAAAFFSVGLYDLCVSGSFITGKAFLYPFVGTSYVGKLNIALETKPAAWMLVCLLFFVMVSIVLISTSLCGRSGKTSKKELYLTACVIAAAVQMVYYINRAVYGNLYIVLPVCSILLAYLGDSLLHKNIWKNHFIGNGALRAVCTTSCVLLGLLALQTIIAYFPAEKERSENRDMEELTAFIESVREGVPEDTPAIGIGISELYSFLGWDSGYYGSDIPDLVSATEEGQAYAKEFVLNSESILINESNLGDIVGDDEEFYLDYELVAQYSYGESVYSLYSRK